MLVGQRMSRNLVTATPHTTHREAVDLMRQHHIRRLPIVDHGQLVGIVVEKDLLSAQPSSATSLSIWEIHSLLDKLTLNRVMRHPVITVGTECPIEEAARIMLARKIGALPVMDQHHLVGLITETDIFRVFVEILGGGEQGLHFSVRLEDHPGKLAALANTIAQAGGNIVSLSTYRAPDASHRDISVKAQGADPRKLKDGLASLNGEIVEVQASSRYEPTLVG